MDRQDFVELAVTIERKQPDLPRYAVVPSRLVSSWRLDGTTTVEVLINGVNVGRRSLVRWDDERWFLTITQQDCRRTGIDTGSKPTMAIAVASGELPEELEDLLGESPEAAQAWARLSRAQRRMLREEIASAKQAATRLRRARRALLDG